MNQDIAQVSEKQRMIMTQGVGIPVALTSASGKTAEGEVRYIQWTSQERVKRALKFLGICWILSVVSIILPIAHFVLVPGFFLAGPIGAIILFLQDEVILGGLGKCPECGADLPLARAAVKWPLSDLCAQCQRTVSIEKLS